MEFSLPVQGSSCNRKVDGIMAQDVQVLKRLDRSSALMNVLEQFKEAIEQGTWPLGGQIPTESELAERLGVGRGVVREALAGLKVSGLIDSHAGRGTFVTHKPSELAVWTVVVGSDNLELLEARYGIDAWINYLAACHATDEEAALIARLAAQMEQAVAEGKSRDEIVALDNEFHDAMAHATHNSVLARLSVIMSASLEHSRRANVSTHDLLEEAMRSHRELSDAVSHHDAQGAFEATRTSLYRVARLQGIDLDFETHCAARA
jgi:DNA-binding FadR family transcriptional regulator